MPQIGTFLEEGGGGGGGDKKKIVVNHLDYKGRKYCLTFKQA